MSNTLQTYQNSYQYPEVRNFADNFLDNLSRAYGFIGAHVEFIGEDLKHGLISTHDAAIRLLALKRTMEAIFEARGDRGAAGPIISNHPEVLHQVNEIMAGQTSTYTRCLPETRRWVDEIIAGPVQAKQA